MPESSGGSRLVTSYWGKRGPQTLLMRRSGGPDACHAPLGRFGGCLQRFSADSPAEDEPACGVDAQPLSQRIDVADSVPGGQKAQ